ncbi:hypothetical protein [Bifidobacterium sp. ESL0704]|uniref:hypothetical protein n=1 Tax=Bifidobacterium sp. ESL0704 TaxID=2983219 RepID=UPI0023F6EB43|nr:hypothetical protein [Bifidobacterium sp. ESL0704]WEV53049.1 hypothetical protein OZX64_00665 [Bifidobacterium sp. ESL0704]
MAPRHPQQKSRLRAATTLLLAILTMFLATACGTTPKTDTTPAPKPQPKTEKITYPAQFLYTYGFEKDLNGSRKAAKEFKDSGEFTDAYATKNGDVIVIATEKQRQNRIKVYDKWIEQGERGFQRESPDYRYEINQDGTAMTVWTDRHLSPKSSSGIFLLVPIGYGSKFYMTGHTGPWDMDITIRNSHTSQQVGHFKASQNINPDMNTFGD